MYLKRNITDISLHHSCKKLHQSKEACPLLDYIKGNQIDIDCCLKFDEVTKEIEIGVSPSDEHEKHALAVPVR